MSQQRVAEEVEGSEHREIFIEESHRLCKSEKGRPETLPFSFLLRVKELENVNELGVECDGEKSRICMIGCRRGCNVVTESGRAKRSRMAQSGSP